MVELNISQMMTKNFMSVFESSLTKCHNWLCMRESAPYMQDPEWLSVADGLLPVPGSQKQARVTFVCKTALTVRLKLTSVSSLRFTSAETTSQTFSCHNGWPFYEEALLVSWEFNRSIRGPVGIACKRLPSSDCRRPV